MSRVRISSTDVATHQLTMFKAQLVRLLLDGQAFVNAQRVRVDQGL